MPHSHPERGATATDIYNLIVDGKYELVFDLAWELDTLVQDQIPRRLVKTLEKMCNPQ